MRRVLAVLLAASVVFAGLTGTAAAQAAGCGLGCSFDQLNQMSTAEREAWLGQLQSTAGQVNAEGWFNNIAGVLQVAREQNLIVPGNWFSLVDASILKAVQDGLRGQLDPGFQPDAEGRLWRDFFAARRQGAADEASIQLWGTAERAATQRGEVIAAAAGKAPNVSERVFMRMGNLYRDSQADAVRRARMFVEMCKQADEGCINLTVEQLLDPRHKSPVLWVARLVFLLLAASRVESLDQHLSDPAAPGTPLGVEMNREILARVDLGLVPSSMAEFLRVPTDNSYDHAFPGASVNVTVGPAHVLGQPSWRVVYESDWSQPTANQVVHTETLPGGSRVTMGDGSTIYTPSGPVTGTTVYDRNNATGTWQQHNFNAGGAYTFSIDSSRGVLNLNDGWGGNNPYDVSRANPFRGWGGGPSSWAFGGGGAVYRPSMGGGEGPEVPQLDPGCPC